MRVQDWLGENNTLGIDIWNRKYRHNNESFDDWLDRVSGNNPHMKQLIIDKKFLFAGRILAGRGCIDHEVCKMTLSNCYVLPPVEDNIESIFDTAKYLARTSSYGGGVGIDISKLAPKDATVRNSARSSTGSVSFMELYSLTTGLIGQHSRMGATMLSMDITHPDIKDFITIKHDLNKVTKANISVKVTDEFMKAVENDDDFKLHYYRKETNEHIEETVKAREIFMMICKEAWETGEPGLLFWDTFENNSLVENDPNYELAGVNPCGELPLPAGGACLLGSINLSAFVTENKEFDFEDFRKTIHEAITGLDTVLNEGIEFHPLQIQRDTAREWRPIGLGIMGLADMLIKMEIVYGSEKAIKLCDSIGYILANESINQSIELAETHGKFPMCDKYAIIRSEFFQNHAHPTATGKVFDSGIRNSQLNAIAPNGTIGTMLGVSTGIEPIFAKYYTRKTVSLDKNEKEYKVFTQIVWDYMQEHGLSEDEVDKLPKWFVTARDIPYQNRVDMQATLQKHIDSSISSTINLPNSATVEDVYDLYMSAWKKGCKGITIFREGCKRTPILEDVSKKDENKKSEEFKDIANHVKDPEKIKEYHGVVNIHNNNNHEWGEVIRANDDCIGRKRTLQTGCGTLHCTAFFDPIDGRLLEVYLSKGSKGGCNNFMIGLSRMISLSARAGVDVYKIADQLQSSGVCASYNTRRVKKKDTSRGSSCPVAVGYAIIDMYEKLQEELNPELTFERKSNKPMKEKKDHSKALCPDCGNELVFEGGCNTCKACGWSKCN